MSKVTLILPKNRKALEDTYAKLLAEAALKMLNEKEREYLIQEIERREAQGDL